MLEMLKANVSKMMVGDHPTQIIQFFDGTEVDRAKSRQQGHIVHQAFEHISIRFAGDQTREVVRVLTDDDREKYHQQYNSWKKNIELQMSGTPLQELTFLPLAAIADLQQENCFTVESLANLSMQAIQAIGMGAQEWKNKAAAWLKDTKDGADIRKLAAENQTLRDDLESMKKQLSELAKLAEQNARTDEDYDEPVKNRRKA
jgi:hypothetical protein